MKIKNLILLVVSLFYLGFFLTGYAEKPPIKLAIFDNPRIDISNDEASNNLEKSYMQGIVAATYMAKKQGLNIDVKTFFFENNLLNIMQEAPKVNAWNPDVIIGVNSSNASLMSRSFFDNCLLLSISATDIELSGLPSNFYSLGVPDSYAAPAIIKFIDQYYPNRNLFILIGADSKQSMDFGDLIASLYKSKHPNNNITISKFISDEIASVDVPSLVKNYHPNDIILLFSLAGSYSMQIKLMNQISDYLHPNKLVFINDVDNWNNRTLFDTKNIIQNNYTAYRLDTLYADQNSEYYKSFETIFFDTFHEKPTNSISFITYKAVMSLVAAIKKYPAPKNLDQKEAILWSYHQALKNDPNWFRPSPLIMYKLAPHKEIYFTSYK